MSTHKTPFTGAVVISNWLKASPSISLYPKSLSWNVTKLFSWQGFELSAAVGGSFTGFIVILNHIHELLLSFGEVFDPLSNSWTLNASVPVAFGAGVKVKSPVAAATAVFTEGSTEGFAEYKVPSMLANRKRIFWTRSSSAAPALIPVIQLPKLNGPESSLTIISGPIVK